jgi:microcystin-dependent protein
VRVGLDDESRPRQRISSIPYAMAAATASTATHGVPAGTIMMFAGAVTPEGWAICDGVGYAKSSYPALYAAIGGTWGETATTFHVPDLRACVPVGSGLGIDENTDARSGERAKLVPRALGATVGSETHTLTEAEIPPHRHSYLDKSGSGRIEIVAWWWNAANEDSFKDDAFTTSAAGGNAAHNNLQPVTYMHYIIKY